VSVASTFFLAPSESSALDMSSAMPPHRGDSGTSRPIGPEWLRLQALRLDQERGIKRNFETREDELEAAWSAGLVERDHSGATTLQIGMRNHGILHLKAANMQPCQMMSWCCGRPIVPLVITHERTKTSNVSSHIRDCFHPHPVHYVMGRSAVMEPVCQKEHSLWWTWKASDSEVSKCLHPPIM
jgi:hypothetical protein